MTDTLVEICEDEISDAVSITAISTIKRQPKGCLFYKSQSGLKIKCNLSFDVWLLTLTFTFTFVYACTCTCTCICVCTCTFAYAALQAVFICYVSTHFRYILTIFVLIRNTFSACRRKLVKYRFIRQNCPKNKLTNRAISVNIVV